MPDENNHCNNQVKYVTISKQEYDELLKEANNNRQKDKSTEFHTPEQLSDSVSTLAEKENSYHSSEDESIQHTNSWLRALVVIETIAESADFRAYLGFNHYDDGSVKEKSPSEANRKQLENDFQSLKDTMAFIYRASHVATNQCENPHIEWRQELLETEKEMIKHKEIPHPYHSNQELPPNWEVPDISDQQADKNEKQQAKTI